MAGLGVYEFADCTLDIEERLLTRSGRQIALAPKAFDVLAVLLINAGRLVTKRELLEIVWPETFVEEGILAVHVSALRKALGGDRRKSCIETVSRSGYRFVAPVTRVDWKSRWSIAVLPARPVHTEFLSEKDRSVGLAITDAVVDRLGRVEQLIVRPTGAVRGFAKAAHNPAAAGRALRVNAVLDISFIGVVDRVTISACLIRAQDGAVLWSRQFEEPAAGVSDAAGPIVEAVALRLGASTVGMRKRCNLPRSPAHAEVHELCGRGRFHLLAYSMHEAPKAVDAFRAAIELDPAYAPAHAGLALAHCAQASFRMEPLADAFAAARVAALRALAMDDLCADAQAALGAVMFYAEWDWEGAERSIERALSINPNHSEAYLLYGQILEAQGRLEEGLQAKLKALERDPFSPLVQLQISLSYWHQRLYGESIEWAKKALDIDPRHPHAREHLAGAYLKTGDLELYWEENLKHAELHGCPAEELEGLKRLAREGGRRAIVRLVLEKASIQPGVFPAVQLALFHGEDGNMDAAFEHLRRAIEARDPCLVHLAVGPQWDVLRDDDRFNECLSRIGLKPPHAAARRCAEQ